MRVQLVTASNANGSSGQIISRSNQHAKLAFYGTQGLLK
jgi:hypothetical protein